MLPSQDRSHECDAQSQAGQKRSWSVAYLSGKYKSAFKERQALMPWAVFTHVGIYQMLKLEFMPLKSLI